MLKLTHPQGLQPPELTESNYWQHSLIKKNKKKKREPTLVGFLSQETPKSVSPKVRASAH